MKTGTGLLLLLLLLLLTSCYPGTQVEVVNNTGQALAVISMDAELKETTYSVTTNQTIQIKVPYKLRVQCGANIYNYDLPPVPPPKSFRKSVGGNWYLERYQIEKSGVIYVLLPDTQAPTTDIPPQPPGYPIRPK